MEKHYIRSGVIAAASAAGVYLLAIGVELVIIRMVHPSALELTWVSDVLLALAFGVVVYLRFNLQATKASLTQLQRERLAWDTELKLAAEIQRELLPAAAGSAGGFCSWAGRLRQAREVGGDFYDVVQAGSERLVFVVGDISGKGIPAALLQSATHHLLRMLIHNQIAPAKLLEILSQTLYEEHQGNVFLTCFLGFVDLKQTLLTYVNAGHPPGLLMRNSIPALLEGGGPPVGLLPEVCYWETTVSLKPGDVGLFVTDGITEAAGGTGQGWAVKAQSVLATEPIKVEPGRVCDKLMHVVAENDEDLPFAGWVDDQTILALVFAHKACENVEETPDLSSTGKVTQTEPNPKDSSSTDSQLVATFLLE